MILKFFIISAIILYVLYAFSGKIMKFLAKILLRKVQKQAQYQYQTQNDIRPEGEIRVETPPSKNIHSNQEGKKYDFDNIGEYVQFEEVKSANSN
jgi:type II secretory pathway pseudopilin PulG